MVTLASDTFSRPDGALNNSTAETGQTWVASTTANVVSGEVQINGNNGPYMSLPRSSAARSVSVTLRAIGTSWPSTRLVLFGRSTGADVGGACYLYLTSTGGIYIYAATTSTSTPSLVAQHAWTAPLGENVDVEAWIDDDGYLQVWVDGEILAAEALSPAQIATATTSTHTTLILLTSNQTLAVDQFGITDTGTPLWTPWPPPDPAAGNLLWWERFDRPDGRLAYSKSPDGTTWDAGEKAWNVVNGELVYTYIWGEEDANIKVGGGVRYMRARLRTPDTGWTSSGQSVWLYPWRYSAARGNNTNGSTRVALSGNGSVSVATASGPTSPPRTAGLSHSWAPPGANTVVEVEVFRVANVVYVRIDGIMICGEPLSPAQLAQAETTEHINMYVSQGADSLVIEEIYVTDEGPSPLPDPGGGGASSGWVVGIPF